MPKSPGVSTMPAAEVVQPDAVGQHAAEQRVLAVWSGAWPRPAGGRWSAASRPCGGDLEPLALRRGDGQVAGLHPAPSAGGESPRWNSFVAGTRPGTSVEHATKSSTGFSARLALIVACIFFSSSAAAWSYW